MNDQDKLDAVHAVIDCARAKHGIAGAKDPDPHDTIRRLMKRIDQLREELSAAERRIHELET